MQLPYTIEAAGIELRMETLYLVVIAVSAGICSAAIDGSCDGVSDVYRFIRFGCPAAAFGDAVLTNDIPATPPINIITITAPANNSSSFYRIDVR